MRLGGASLNPNQVGIFLKRDHSFYIIVGMGSPVEMDVGA